MVKKYILTYLQQNTFIENNKNEINKCKNKKQLYKNFIVI